MLIIFLMIMIRIHRQGIHLLKPFLQMSKFSIASFSLKKCRLPIALAALAIFANGKSVAPFRGQLFKGQLT